MSKEFGSKEINLTLRVRYQKCNALFEIIVYSGNFISGSGDRSPIGLTTFFLIPQFSYFSVYPFTYPSLWYCFNFSKYLMCTLFGEHSS